MVQGCEVTCSHSSDHSYWRSAIERQDQQYTRIEDESLWLDRYGFFAHLLAKSVNLTMIETALEDF